MFFSKAIPVGRYLYVHLQIYSPIKIDIYVAHYFGKIGTFESLSCLVFTHLTHNKLFVSLAFFFSKSGTESKVLHQK